MTARYLLPVFLLASAITGFAACGGSDSGASDAFSGGGGSGVCSFDPGCGQVCSDDGDCNAGLHCTAGMCTAECGHGIVCPDGGTCDDSGRCQGASGDPTSGTFVGSATTGSGAGGAGGNSGPGTGGAGGGCGDVTVGFAPQIPTVALLIDQSGSMGADFGGVTRWQAIYDAIMDPGVGVAAALEANVRLGLVLYSGEDAGPCPDLTQVMPPVLDNYAAMSAVWTPATNYKDDTPTGESVSAIVPQIAAVTDPGPKLIVLATDGDPDTCADPNSNGTQPPKDVATAAVQAAFAMGIGTVIIAVGDQVAAQHQQDMANAGAGLPVPADPSCLVTPDPAICAPTYKPSDPAALVAAFNSIIQGQRTCVFTLDGSVIPGKECMGVVKIDGAAISCNDPDGWKLDDPSTIEFTGAACAQILSEPNVDITAHFPCDAAMTGSGGGSSSSGPH